MMGKDNQVSVMIRCQWRSGDVTQLFYVCVSFCSLNFKWDFSPGYGLSPPVGTQVSPRWKNISRLGFFIFRFLSHVNDQKGEAKFCVFFFWSVSQSLRPLWLHVSHYRFCITFCPQITFFPTHEIPFLALATPPCSILSSRSHSCSSLSFSSHFFSSYVGVQSAGGFWFRYSKPLKRRPQRHTPSQGSEVRWGEVG